MLISGNERFITKRSFKVYSESLDSVAHGISCCDTRQVLKEMGHDSLVYRLIEIVFIIGAMVLLGRVLLGGKLISTETTA